MLVKNHRLSNSDDCEIKKLFNVYNGLYYITKIISETTIAVRNDETGNEELINRDLVRSFIRETAA